ncbi:hypothetical protein TNCV_4249551 [Trichonephila clavipes]|nr:hypothetical protein TNCV_4249551 [Trichonephila clavipes]
MRTHWIFAVLDPDSALSNFSGVFCLLIDGVKDIYHHCLGYFVLTHVNAPTNRGSAFQKRNYVARAIHRGVELIDLSANI